MNVALNCLPAFTVTVVGVVAIVVPSNLMVIALLGEKLLPVTVTEVDPEGPKVGFSVIVGVTVKVWLKLGAAGVTPSDTVTVCAPATADEGMAIVAVNEPVELVVTTGGLVWIGDPSSVTLMLRLAANSVPVMVTTVPTGPVVGDIVYAAVL